MHPKPWATNPDCSKDALDSFAGRRCGWQAYIPHDIRGDWEYLSRKDRWFLAQAAKMVFNLEMALE